MKYNTQYLPENFEQHKPEETTLWHFEYSASQMAEKGHDSTYCLQDLNPLVSI